MRQSSIGHSPLRRSWALRGAAALVVVAAAGLGIRSVAADGDPLSRAWDRAAEAGAFHFRSDVEQVTSPVASAVNVGRSSRIDQLHVEGKADAKDSQLEMQVWASGGTVVNTAPDVEFRMIDGRFEQRVTGGEWSASAGSSDLVAPGGNALTYLDAATDVVELGRQSVGGRTVTRYSFAVDGSVFATVMAEQTEDAMRRRGELAPGARVQPSVFHRNTTGVGELWVGSDGLPVRQVLSLQFPEHDNETVSAEIMVEFFNFSDENSSEMWNVAADLLPWLLAVFAAMGGLWGLLRPVEHRRALTRSVAVSVAVSVFVTSVIGPGSSISVAAAPVMPSGVVPASGGPMVDRRDVLASMSTQLADPHSNLMDAMPLTTAFEAETGVDTDGDGLTDFVEARIGTSIDDADTDGDTIPDLAEVEGFSYQVENGLFWYGDPFQPDSNGDRISDGIEWVDRDGDTLPDDTDSDGVPDAFDDDNDDDMVPDHIDASPFSAVLTIMDEDTPFEFVVDGATQLGTQPRGEGLPLLVDFQLRPVSQTHLQFALNPMDWPSDDQGQVRDVNDGDGDMRLVPALEIIVPALSHVLPVQADLDPYSVSVLASDPHGQRAVYVPLQLVTDERTGARVAFSGRMPYLSQEAWGSAHEIRLVWMVQVANDVVCDPAADDAPEGCSAAGYVYDQPQVVHRYFDEWTLTGLKVTQEHGSEIALIHQDPAVGLANVTDVGPTWLLANLLSERFLSAVRDDGGRLVQEISMDNLSAKLDRTLIGVTEPNAEYGLPNVFRVDQAAYSSFGEAVIQTSALRLPSVLEQYESSWTQAAPVKPLVMSAYSATTRSAGLDGLVEADGTVEAGPSSVRVDLNPSAAPVEVNTYVGTKWTYYCGGSGAVPVWSACNASEMWAHLEATEGEVNLDPIDLTPVDGPIDAEDAAAQNMAVQLFALATSNGTTTLIATDSGVGGASIVQLFDTTDNSTLLDEIAQTREYQRARTSNVAVKFVANTLLNRNLQAAYPIVKGLAKFKITALTKVALTRMSPRSLGVKKVIGVGIATSVILAGTVLALAFSGDETKADVAAVLTVAISALFGVVQPIYIAVKIIQMSSVRLLELTGTALGLTRTGAAIGLVLSVGLAWGFFVAGVVSSGVTAFSAEFDQALADSIAATIFAVFIFGLSLTGIGIIVVGVVALIDGILQLICTVGGVDLGTDLTDQGCFTLSGAAIKITSAAVYGYELMVGVEDLVTVGDVDISLDDDLLGYQVGNKVIVELPVSTSVAHEAPSTETWQIIPYLWFYSQGNLKSSTMDHTLTTPGPQTLVSERDTMTEEWSTPVVYDSYIGKDLYKTSTSETLDAKLVFDSAGVNQSFEVHLNSGYAFPAAECWTVPQPFIPPFIVPICYVRTFDGDNSSAFDPRVYDVFPANIKDFTTTTSRGGGARRLAWDDAFGSLPDADFDGLYSSAFGGLDPNDNNWDTDSDRLSDAFEVEQLANGQALSLLDANIDRDGLTDAQELSIGTNPGMADTDNDGLLDGEEVHHLDLSSPEIDWAGGWKVTVFTDIVADGDNWMVTPSAGDRTVVVSSDPLTADSDGDGIGDQAERQLASSDSRSDRIDDSGVPYHPNVPNASPFGLVLSIDDPDGFVRSGQELTVRADALGSIPLAPGVVALDVPERLGGPIDPDRLDFDPTTFDGHVERTITVPAGASSGDATITAAGTARLPSNGGPSTVWDAAGQLLAAFGRIARVDVTTADRASSDDFLISGAGSDMFLPGGMGDVGTIRYPAGGENYLDYDAHQYEVWGLNSNGVPVLEPVTRENTQFKRGANNAETACLADEQQCLTVWDHYDNCTDLTVNWLQVVDQDELGTGGIEPGIYLDRNDGNGQRMLWWTGQRGLNDLTNGWWSPYYPSAGFPFTTTVCGEAKLSVLEIDGNAYTLPVGTYETLQQTYGTDVNLVAGDSFAFDETTAEAFLRQSGFPLTNFTLNFTNLDYRDAQTGFNDCGVGSNYCNRVDINVTLRPHQNYRIGVSNSNEQLQLDAAVGSTNSIDRNPSISVWRLSSGEELFFVSWERVNVAAGNRSVMSQILNPDGTAWGQQALVATLPGINGQAEIHNLDSRSDTFPMVFWRDSGMSTIWGRSIFSPNAVIASDATNSLDRETFDIAYDRFTSQTVVVYETTGGAIVAKRFDGASTTPAATTTVFPAFPRVYDPSVDFVPTTGEWLVTAHGRQIDGSTSSADYLRSVAATLPADFAVVSYVDVPPLDGVPIESGLACPAWTSVPLVDVRFEELPGATTFADSSRFGNDGTATGSVAAGIAGASGAKWSDYGVRFHSAADTVSVPNPTVDASTVTLDESTVAFWIRFALPRSGEAFEVGTGLQGLPLLIDSTGDLSLRNSLGTVSRAQTAVADGSWHHVALTVSRYGSFAVTSAIVDGVTELVSPNSLNSSTPSTSFDLSGGSSFVDVDHVRVYASALSEPQVRELKNTTDQTNCLSVASTLDGPDPAKFNLVRHSFDEVDDRGGRIDAAARVSVVVDNDQPTSDVTLPTTVVSNPGGNPMTLMIGGTARDSTSGIDRVEVQVNGGAWTIADGAEAWSLPITVTSGQYLVGVRAFDRAGNAQLLPIAQEFDVDGVEPFLTLDLPTGVVRPAEDPVSGERSLVLSGVAFDISPRAGVESVEVQLAPTGEAMREDGWQQALISGESWSANYRFSANAREPYGAFDIRVRAVDRAGNVVQTSGSVVVDGAPPSVALDATDNVLTGSTVVSGDVVDVGAAGVESVEVSLTSLADVVNQAAPSWLPASLDGGRWTFAVPSGMEGIVQIDLRAVDAAGNEMIETGLWRGILDSSAPRVSMTVTATGKTGAKPGNVQYRVVCSAEDRFLDEATFTCPGATLKKPDRVFMSDAALDSLFPDLVGVVGMESEYLVWSSSVPTGRATACDTYGNCSESAAVSPESRRELSVLGSLSVDPTRAAVLTPGAGNEIGGLVTVGFDAVTDDWISMIEILIDGTVTATQSFAVGEVADYQGAIAVPALDEVGEHLVEVRVVTHDGQDVKSEPVIFTYDPNAPVVTIGATALDADASWGPGTNMYRLSGTVSDGGTLQALQVRVGGGPWIDAYFADGEWSVAVQISDADGEVFALAVRATDRAGNVTTVYNTGEVNLSPSVDFVRPDGAIDACVGCDTGAPSATFEFSATPGSNELSTFECALDGLPREPCSNGFTLYALSGGSHTLLVSAIDAGGFRDLSPASLTWTVDVSGPQATIRKSPSDPSNDRRAEFEFDGPMADVFSCSLDGEPFEVCSSPFVYGDLSYGEHEFRVRVTSGSTTGTPVAYRWEIVNAAPDAKDQTVRTPIDESVSVSLRAVDTDEVSYRVIDIPLHGTLQGVAPELEYVPFEGFVGSDSFTFEADDSQETSRLATVSIEVLPTTRPEVIVSAAAGQLDPTKVNPLVFDVEFDQNVTGLGVDDVVVAGSADLNEVTLELIEKIPFRSWTLTVGGLSGSGTVTVSIRDGAAANTALLESRVSNDATVGFDAQSPSASIQPVPGQSLAVGTGPFEFDVVFDEPVTGLSVGDVRIGGTAGIRSATLTGSGSRYVLSVPDSASPGTLTIELVGGAASDQLGNASPSVRVTVEIRRLEIPATGNGSLHIWDAMLLVLLGLVLAGAARRRQRLV